MKLMPNHLITVTINMSNVNISNREAYFFKIKKNKKNRNYLAYEFNDYST